MHMNKICLNVKLLHCIICWQYICIYIVFRIRLKTIIHRLVWIQPRRLLLSYFYFTIDIKTHKRETCQIKSFTHRPTPKTQSGKVILNSKDASTWVYIFIVILGSNCIFAHILIFNYSIVRHLCQGHIPGQVINNKIITYYVCLLLPFHYVVTK